jgi:hypothetical protein
MKIQKTKNKIANLEYFKNVKELTNGRKICICPFEDHNDTSASFVVYPDGFYHCYGCGRWGKMEDLFGEESKYSSMSSIDFDQINERTLSVAKIRDTVEKKIRKLTGTVPNSTLYKVYDEIDLMFLQLVNNALLNKVDLATEIKKESKRIMKEVLHGVSKKDPKA